MPEGGEKMIKSTEHFSFTVSNLDEALYFFCDLLGLTATPAVVVDNEGVQKIIGMPGAQLRISLVRLPGGANIELIEYVKPRGEIISLRTCNTGVAHVAFLVDDIQKMYGNDGKGHWAVCYLRGPDGITFEFIERQA
jgi:glyoxylase I family protein